MAKIFIASREVRGTENFPVAEHSYWVKDEDGDVTTTDDQTIIRGGSAEVDGEEVYVVEIDRKIEDSRDDLKPPQEDPYQDCHSTRHSGIRR